MKYHHDRLKHKLKSYLLILQMRKFRNLYYIFTLKRLNLYICYLVCRQPLPWLYTKATFKCTYSCRVKLVSYRTDQSGKTLSRKLQLSKYILLFYSVLLQINSLTNPFQHYHCGRPFFYTPLFTKLNTRVTISGNTVTWRL